MKMILRRDFSDKEKGKDEKVENDTKPVAEETKDDESKKPEEVRSRLMVELFELDSKFLRNMLGNFDR